MYAYSAVNRRARARNRKPLLLCASVLVQGLRNRRRLHQLTKQLIDNYNTKPELWKELNYLLIGARKQLARQEAENLSRIFPRAQALELLTQAGFLFGQEELYGPMLQEVYGP